MNNWLAERVVIDANGCWIWQKATTGGYGRAFFAGRPRYAHRISFEMANGPIPDGLVVDHLCFERACVNPEHLQLLSRGANSSRTKLAARGVWRCGHPRVGNTYRPPKNGTRTCLRCHRTRALRHYHRKQKEHAQ